MELFLAGRSQQHVAQIFGNQSRRGKAASLDPYTPESHLVVNAIEVLASLTRRS